MRGDCSLDVASVLKAHDPNLRDVRFGPFSLIEGIDGLPAVPLIATNCCATADVERGQ